MEAYVRDEAKLKRKEFIRDIRTDIKLYLKNPDATANRDLTTNHILSEMATRLLGTSGLLTLSIMTPFSQCRNPRKIIQGRRAGTQ